MDTQIDGKWWVNKRKTKQKAGGNQAERHKFKSPPEKGWENALPIVRVCAYICVCVSVLKWKFARVFGAFHAPLARIGKTGPHPRGCKTWKWGRKKAAEQPRKTALQEKFQFPKGSQREWQRVIRDISENLYWLQSSQWGGFSGQDSCASEQLPLLGNFGQQDSRYASADCLEGKVEGPFPTDIRAYRNLKIF